MQVQPEPNITPLQDIKAYKAVRKIQIRVSRIWRPQNYDGETYDGLHYILVDEGGDAIHAMIDEDTYEYMTEKMEEGKVYDIYKFHIKNYTPKYKVVDHSAQLHFNEYTRFKLVNDAFPPIPRHAFRFLEFDQFKANLNNQTAVADVYGCIKSVIPEHKVYLRDKKQMESLSEIVLENLRREDLTIAIWGHIARNFDVKTVETSQSPVLAAITTLRTTMFNRDYRGTSTKDTCVVINPHVEQEQDYKTEFSKSGDKVKIQFRQGASQDRKQQTIKTVSELYELNPADYMNETVICNALIKRYSTRSGWWYRACSHPGCFKQLKKQEEEDDLICGQHGAQNPLPCYRIHMAIEDYDNQITVTLMGKPAEQLFGCSCQDLLNKRLYQTEQELPIEIEKTIGQAHLFEIKIGINGDMVIKSISQKHQIPQGTAETPAIATPEKMLERKRSMYTTGTTLFTSESEKRCKSIVTTVHPLSNDSQEKETSSASSSTSKDQYEKRKID